MIDGILLIDKEEGISSYFVINKLKRFFPRKHKIGHAGTLDPFATGLLIVLLGKATKLMDSIHLFEKTYEVTAEFGYATDTQDVTGTKIFTSLNNLKIEESKIQEAIVKRFVGEIEQTPPNFSANKVHGQRAYDLARKGEDFILKPKKISVKDFEIVQYKWPFVTFRITCSTGTYIRTLVNDLGMELRTYATAINLRRLSIGDFDVKNAIKSEGINDEVLDSIIEIDKVNEILNNGKR